MNNNDFFDIENQIRDAIDNAYKYIDYANLKATEVREDIVDSINHAAEGTINEVKSKFKNTTDDLDKKIQGMSKKFEDNINKLTRKEQKEMYKYIAKKPNGKIRGPVYSIIGIVGSVAFAVSMAVCSILTMFNSRIIKFGANLTIGMLFIFFAASLFLALKGAGIRKRTIRFNKYAAILKGNNYSEISKLAESVDKKNKFVLKDIQKMMNLDMFREGHISEDKNYFMLSNEIYEEYLNSLKSFNERSNSQVHRDKEEDINNAPKSELTVVIELGQKYINEIKSVNYALNGNNICTKLYDLENLTENIFNNIEKNPDKLPLVKKFLNHYMPMTLKLVKSYKELNDQPIEGGNIRKAKIEIEKSIDLINSAFEKLLDNLFEDVVLDVSTDISVLETLFSQDGLTEDELHKKR